MPRIEQPDPRHAADTLRRIAELLKVPVEALAEPPTVESPDDLLTLLQFWSEIDDTQARRRIVNLARQEAKRER